MEDLQLRHRKEQRDLQSRITQKKKNATKKTRKGVNDECERLERELREKQQAEVDDLAGVSTEGSLNQADQADQQDDQIKNSDLAGPPNGVASQNHDETVQTATTVSEEPHKTKKPNRQKARLARRAAEKEASIAEAENEAAMIPDRRDQEMKSMKEEMKKRKLEEIDVRPDGHCLYSACALGIPRDQVNQSGPFSEGYQNVRFATASFITKHPDDFSAFLEEPIETYVKKIKDTAEWGGQLELQAIARTYNVTIHVLQADGRVEIISSDEGRNKKEVWLAYYRHSFGLGEHYNALKKGG